MSGSAWQELWKPFTAALSRDFTVYLWDMPDTANP
jgi:hypothetical protein